MKIKNKLQECIKHIKTMFYTKLCVSLKKDITEQSDSKEKNSRFDDNFDYREIIDKYYNGDKQKFMDEKTEYRLKINRLKELIKDTKSRIIGYSELKEIEELIIELGGMTQDEYDKLLKKYEYNFDTLYENIIDERKKSKTNQIKTSEIIGTLSGTTMIIQYKFIKNYKEFLKQVKK